MTVNLPDLSIEPTVEGAWEGVIVVAILEWVEEWSRKFFCWGKDCFDVMEMGGMSALLADNIEGEGLPF